MQHDGASDLIEIDRSSVQRGGPLSPLETDVKNDWAIARLREDAIEKFAADRVFAFFWDVRLTHDQIVKSGYTRSATLVLSPEHTFALDESCERVTDDHPSRYAFGVEEIFFVRCPSERLQVGSSGSALAILSPDDTWNLGGQIIAGTMHGQLFLGTVPTLKQTLAIAYLQELIRRGLDPRER
jgi:hypothetical protein